MSPHIITLNKPRWRKKIAAFDYDWTLVKPLNGRTHAKDVNDAQWLRASVPTVLKDYYSKGYAIMVFTNQKIPWKLESIETKMKELDIPITIAVGILDADRKPHTTMWQAVVKQREWDKKHSFFAGDAAGRPNDWSDSDAVFAKAIGISFKTPEEMFPFDKRKGPEQQGEPVILEVEGREAIVMIGYPGSGKTTLAKTAFPNYTIIDGDKLKTADAMVRAASLPANANKSVVFDATNAETNRRSSYIAWANKVGIPIRAVWVDKTIDAAMEAAAEREHKGGPHIPRVAFYAFRKRFVEPTISEGFSSILHIE